MAKNYKDDKGNQLTVLTETEHAQCAEKDTPIVSGWSFGGHRITGDSIAAIAIAHRESAETARENFGKLEGAEDYAEQSDAIAGFCQAIIDGKIQGTEKSPF